MATSSDPVHGHEFVNFDEYIDIQLRKTGSTIKSTDVLTAVVGILTLVTLYLLLFVIFDHWLVPGGFGPVTRGIMLAIVGSAACAWLVMKVIVPWRCRVSWLYAASTIEKASPALKSSLLNLVDMSRSGHEVSPEIYHSIERRAALALTHVDVNEAVDRRSLLRLSNALLAVVVLFCLYWIFSPKNPATSLWRAMVPSADVGVATRTEIFNVHPGDKDVLARSQLEVTADVRGEVPAQTFLYFTTADRKFVDERIEMRLENESARKFRCVMTGDNGGGILQNMTYRIVAGDAATPEYTIRVIHPPAAAIESIRLESPAYTRREPVVQTTGAIDALEGTRVMLKAHANMPLRPPASLQFFDDETASRRAEEIPIRITGETKLEVEWKLEIRSDGTYPHYYRIFCTNTAGASDPSPSLYSLAIRPDQPPEIILHDPKTDLKLPANAVLPLVIEARDDFALRYIDLNIEKDGSPVNGPTIYSAQDDQQLKSTHNTTYNWSLKDYHFRPKDTVTFWLQAKDNRQPIANASKTPALRIHIIDPVPEDQVKKDLEMAQQRQKQEKEKSDAERAAQDKPDDEKASADAREKPQNRGDKPKEKKQLASRQQQKDQQAQNAEHNENADEQNGQGQNGEGQKQGKGKAGQDQKGQNEKGSAADGENKKQELNPDDPADDPKALQRLLDKQRRDQEKEKNSSGAGQGNQGSDDQKKDAQKKGDKNSSSPDQKKSESGSASDSEPNGKSGEKKSGQSEDKKKDSSSGSKPLSDQNEKKTRGDAEDQSHAGQEKKEQAAATGDKKSESAGSKPQGEKSSESDHQGEKKEGGKKDAANESNGGREKGSENAEQKGPKNGSADGSPESKEKREKTAGRHDDKSPGQKQPGASNEDKRPNSNSQQEPGSKEEPSRSGSPKADRTPDAKQPSGNQGNPGDAGTEKGSQQKKKEGERQSGNEAGNEKGNNQDNTKGQPKNQSQSNDGQSAKPNDADEASKKEATNNDAATKERGTKEPASKDAADKKRAAGKQDEPGEASQKGASSQKEDANQKTNADRKGETARKARDNDQPRPDNRKANGQKSDGDDKKADKTDVTPGDDATGQKTRPDDRQRKKPVDQESPPSNPKDIDERPDTIRDKKHRRPVGGGDSQVTPPADAQQSGAPKDGTAQQGSQRSEEQKSAGQKAQAQQETGGREKASSKQQPGANQKESAGSKNENSKEGQQGQKAQGQQGQGQQGQQGQGQQGQQGQGQKGKGGAGQKGSEGGSNTPGTKGGKSGAGTGDSTKGNNGGGFNDGTGSGQGEPLEDTSKQANLDYAKKATDLVLRRLESQLQRGQIDKKTEEELGWNKEQIRRFVERMRSQAQATEDPNSPAAEARRLQFEETLKSLNLRSAAKSRSSRAVPKSSDAEMESKRSIPPPEYRDLYNAFTKSLAKPLPPPADDKK